jgi:type II secretory pathway component GspD/PulD (secretin)
MNGTIDSSPHEKCESRSRIDAIHLVSKIRLVIVSYRLTHNREDIRMRLRAFLFSTIALSFAFANTTLAQQPSKPEVSIQLLKNAAANDVAKALTTFAERKSMAVTVVTEPVSNTIAVAGDAAQVKQLLELATRLDAPPTRIVAQLMIVQVPTGFAKEVGLADGTEDIWSLTERETRMLTAAIRNAKEIDIISRPQIQTCDNQSAIALVGDSKNGPSVMVRVTPRVMPEGGLLTRLETVVKKSVGAEDESKQTTAKAQDGGTIVFRAANTSIIGNATNETFLIVTLHRVKSDPHVPSSPPSR